MTRKILVALIALILGFGSNLHLLFAAEFVERAALVAPEILPAALPSTNFSMEETGTAPILNDAEKSSVVEIKQTVLSPSPISSVTPGRSATDLEAALPRRSSVAVRRRGSRLPGILPLDSRLRGNDEHPLMTQTLKKIKSRLPKKNFSALAGLDFLSTIYDGARINMSGSGLEPEERDEESFLSKFSKPILPEAIKTIGTGKPNSGNEGFRSPVGVSVDFNGLVYVADTWNHRIQIFESYPSVKYLATIGAGEETNENAGFRYPVEVAVDSQGRVYVADAENNRIQIFEPYPSLKYLGTIGARERKSLWSRKQVPKETNENDGFRYPGGISLDSDDRIYVSDVNNNRIQIFEPYPSLKYLGTIGTGDTTDGNEGFHAPSSVSIDSDGRIYVADQNRWRIQVFDRSWKYLFTLKNKQGTSVQEGFNTPSGLFVDFKGRIYVTDGDTHRVQIFDSAGKYLRTLGGGEKTFGIPLIDSIGLIRGMGEATADNWGFNHPRKIFVDNKGLIYVADYDNHRVQIFPSLDEMDAADKKRREEAEKIISQEIRIPIPQTEAGEKGKPESAAEHFKIDWDKLL